MLPYAIGLDIGITSVGWATVALDEDDRPYARTILELRFKEGRTNSEVGEIVGRSSKRVYQIIREAARKMRHPQKRRLNHYTLRYGLEASRKIAKGDAEVCFECGKLIESGNHVYLVPSDDLESGFGLDFSHMLKICCSEQCAKQSVEGDLEIQKRGLAKLAELKLAGETEIARLEDYAPIPLSLSEAQEEIQKSGLSRFRYSRSSCPLL